MNNDELKELLRLTAIALGDGWEVALLNDRGIYRHPEGPRWVADLNGDSRWLECELLIDVQHGPSSVRADRCADESMDVLYQAWVLLSDHNNDRQAATRWAVLKCAAKIGKAKEEAK